MVRSFWVKGWHEQEVRRRVQFICFCLMLVTGQKPLRKLPVLGFCGSLSGGGSVSSAWALGAGGVDVCPDSLRKSSGALAQLLPGRGSSRAMSKWV